MLFIVLALFLSLAALFVVAYPILTAVRQAGPVASSAEDRLEELIAQREAAFQAIRDLTFDRHVGKITDEDFVVFEANLKQCAADALRAIDLWEAQMDGALDAVLEQEISSRRSALAAPGIVCPGCGRPSVAGDVFCAGCGRPLVQGPASIPGKPVLTCPHCNRPLEPGDRFCAGCGQPVGKAAVAAH